MSFYTAACKTCRFSVEYKNILTKPTEPVEDPKRPKGFLLWFYILFGTSETQSILSDNDPERLWRNYRWGLEDYNAAEKLCDNYVQCRLNPEAVQKPKASWCSHYKEDSEKA